MQEPFSHSLYPSLSVERLSSKIALQEYGSALTLARAYGLSTDPVYQKMWLEADVSKASIKDYLAKVHTAEQLYW